jgi:hypothetical protein
LHIIIEIIVKKILLPHAKTRRKESRESENQIFLFVNLIIYYLLITMLLLSRKEKEKMVIKLAQEGKTTREIAKLVHISLKDIGKILRKVTGDEKGSESNELEVEKKGISKLSIYAQAFHLFREKKPLIEVVITLDLDADTVLSYYKNYLRLNDMFKLVNLYHKLGEDLPLFLHLFDRVKKEGLTREEITDMLQSQRNVSDMQETLIWLNNHIPELWREKQELEQEIARLRDIKNFMDT